MTNQDIDIVSLQEGNEEEFHRLFNQLYPRLMSLACRFVPEFIAADIVQEVFIMYWEQKNSLFPDSIYSYLYKSTQNNCLNYLKHQTIESDYAETLQEAARRVQMMEENTDNNVLWNEVLERDVKKQLQLAIDTLPAKCKEAFILSFYHDLTYKEIGERMNISPRTVEDHVQKAYKILRKLLKHLLFILLLSAH